MTRPLLPPGKDEVTASARVASLLTTGLIDALLPLVFTGP